MGRKSQRKARRDSEVDLVMFCHRNRQFYSGILDFGFYATKSACAVLPDFEMGFAWVTEAATGERNPILYDNRS